MNIKTVHKFKLPYQYKIKGLNWVLNRATKYVENRIIRSTDINSCVQPGTNAVPVIVSLTTYPGRTQKVQWTIKSILNQNVKIDKFVLWLAEEQYPDKVIPDEINQYVKYGLEVKFCDDLRSHKKYYYSMMENPNAIIITVDDDVIYPEDTVEKLLKSHEKYADAVICNQGRLIKIDNGNFAPYNEWKTSIPKDITKPSYLILPIGEGGVLYPAGTFSQDVFCKEKIISLAYTADDLWLKFMAVKNRKKAMVTSDIQRAPNEVYVKGLEDVALNKQNVLMGKNDMVIENLNKDDATILEFLISESI